MLALRTALFAYLFILIQADSACLQKTQQRDMYISLHDAITRHCIEYPEKQHVDLLPLGLRLDYDDFNPGKASRFVKTQMLPVKVIEKALPLVDKIFPTGATVQPKPSANHYRFNSLSSTFEFILAHMMALPSSLDNLEQLQKQKDYLQEPVPNPELVVQNETDLPRYMLYDHYRCLYLKEKEEKETQVASHMESLTQEDYEKWGIKVLPTLESNVDAAFQKWMIFGYKTEVEQTLLSFDIDTHEDRLMSTRALFKSMAVFSERHPHVKVYPFRFEPKNWYQVLNTKEAQSSDQLRYQMSLLQAQQALMNAAKNDLAKRPYDDVNISLIKINDILETLHERVRNAVDTLMQMEVDCFTKVDLVVCGEIANTHAAFKVLLSDVAEYYEQAAYLESILNGRIEVLPVFLEKLGNVAGRVKSLDKQISAAKKAETRDSIDITTGGQVDPLAHTTGEEAGKTEFSFRTSMSGIDDLFCENEAEDIQECTDIRIPPLATQSPLWSIYSSAVDPASADMLHDTLSSVEMEIRATLQKVDIVRPWLNPDILMDPNIYTMIRKHGPVSPGRLVLLAESGQYLMPQYTSSLVLASNVTLFFPGLGSWRDEEDIYDAHTNAIINMLMKYAYAPTLEGGYGPFALAPKGGIRKDVHNFRVERKNGGLLIRVPGAQVIGFVSTTVPRFPDVKENVPQPTVCPSQPLSSVHDKRTKSDSLTETRNLAIQLFSDGTDEQSNEKDNQITVTPGKEDFKVLDEIGQNADLDEKIALKKLDEKEQLEESTSFAAR